MIKKHKEIEGFFKQIGFREKIVIGMYGEGRVYFHIDFSDELANGLMTAAFVDESIYEGIKELIGGLEAILEGLGKYKPGKDEEIH